MVCPWTSTYRFALRHRAGSAQSKISGTRGGRAVVAAQELDDCTDRQSPWPIDEDASSKSQSDSDYDSTEESEIDEQAEVAAVHYRYAVRRVEKAFPNFIFPGIIRAGQGAAVSLDVACEDNSWVCVSCGGRAGWERAARPL